VVFGKWFVLLEILLAFHSILLKIKNLNRHAVSLDCSNYSIAISIGVRNECLSKRMKFKNNSKFNFSKITLAINLSIILLLGCSISIGSTLYYYHGMEAAQFGFVNKIFILN